LHLNEAKVYNGVKREGDMIYAKRFNDKYSIYGKGIR
jgi:hypothetical protein